MCVYLFEFFFVKLENFSLIWRRHHLVKGCRFWPMLRTHGHWAVRILYVHPFILVIFEDTHTYCREFSSEAITIQWDWQNAIQQRAPWFEIKIKLLLESEMSTQKCILFPQESNASHLSLSKIIHQTSDR